MSDTDRVAVRALPRARHPLHGHDALAPPRSVEALKRVIHTHQAPVRIERFPMDMDSWCHFTLELRALERQRPARPESLDREFLAAVGTYATNLDIATRASAKPS